MSVDLVPAELGPLGVPLGVGAEAVVFEAPALRLDDVPGELVYKQYLRPRPRQTSTADVVAARLALSADRRDRLDAATAWPVRQVVADDELRGVVLPRIAAGFQRTMTLPSGERSTDPRDAQGLMVPSPSGPAALGLTIAPETADRLRICRDLARTLDLLHRAMDLAYGDLSARNVLVRFEGRPRVLVLDCDAARPLPSSVPALHTPDWEPPEPGPATAAADVYKFGLFVLRTVSPRPWSSVNRDPSWAQDALDAEGADLLYRSLHPRPDARPAAREWAHHLSRMLGEAVEPPRFHGCGLHVTVLAPGDTTTVLWHLDRPARVSVTAGGQVLGEVDATAGPGRLVVAPASSAVLRLRAENDAGRDERVAGAVAVLAAPPAERLPVPIPRLPATDLGDVPSAPRTGLPTAVYGSVDTAFPPVLTVATGVPAVPGLPPTPWWVADPLAVPHRLPTRRGASR